MQQQAFFDSQAGIHYTDIGKYRIYEANNYLQNKPTQSMPQEQVFEEYLVVDNIACTTKLKDIGPYGSKFKYNDTKNKEVFLLDFRGTWEQLKALLTLLSQLGVSWKRNVEKYDSIPTHLLIMDYDDLNPYGAETLLKSKTDKNILIIDSASCNYIPVKEGAEIDMSKEWKCKYHVFQYIPKGFKLETTNLFRLTDEFSEKYRNLSEGRDEFKYDSHLCTNKWNVLYSKAPLPEPSKIATNNRYSCKAGLVFDYVEFANLFRSHTSVNLTKCTDYVPNAKHDKYMGIMYNAGEEYVKQTSQSDELIKEINADTLARLRCEQVDPLSTKKLLELAGIPEGNSVFFPHFRVGRPRYVQEGKRNGIASLICHLIAFNLYSFKKSFNISEKIRSEDIIKSFNCVFNESNVQDYKEFMKDFNIIRSIEANKHVDSEYETVCKTKKHPSIKCTKLYMEARNIRKSLDRDLMTLKTFLPTNGVIMVPSTRTEIKQLKNVYSNGIIDVGKVCKQYEVNDCNFEELLKLKFQEYSIPFPPSKTIDSATIDPFASFDPLDEFMGLSSFDNPIESYPSNWFEHLFETDFLMKCEQAEIPRSDLNLSHCYPGTRAKRSDKGKKHNVKKGNPNKGVSKYDFLKSLSKEELDKWFASTPLSKQDRYYIKHKILGKKQL